MKRIDFGALSVGAREEQSTGLPSNALEDILTQPWGFGLETATPVQRAVCRIADGVPLGDLAAHPDVIRVVGDASALSTMPDEIDVLSGIRTFKSKLTAAAAIQATQVCDVSHVGTGETPRVPVVSLDKDLAHVVFGYVKGYCESTPAFRALLVSEPTTDTVTLRHPTGMAIEIQVSAGKRAGSSLVARWLASVIFDEAPRMLGQEDGVVNLDDSLQAVRGRILRGGKIWKVGSPWAPFGPIYEEVREHEGKPTPELVVIRGPAWLFNPYWWTAERIEKLKRKDPQAYKTDVLAEFGDVSLSMFSDELISSCERAEPVIGYEPGCTYEAAMDPATRGNSWSLVIGTTRHDGKRSVVLARQWTGTPGNPLSPREVLKEIAALLAPYKLAHVYSDQWAADAIRDLAIQEGISVIDEPATAQSNVDGFDSLKAQMQDGKVELPADANLRDDLKRVRRKLTQSGVSIELPKTADGRHCDYAPAIVRCIARPMVQPKAESPRPSGEAQALQWEMEQRKQALMKRRTGQRADPWAPPKGFL